MLYEQFGELKYKRQNQEFWRRGILCEHCRKEQEPNMIRLRHSGSRSDAAFS